MGSRCSVIFTFLLSGETPLLTLPRTRSGGLYPPFIEPLQGLCMHLPQGGSNQDGFLHLHLSQFVAEAQAAEQSSRPHRMRSHEGFKGLYILPAQHAIQVSVKARIPLLDLSFIHGRTSAQSYTPPTVTASRGVWVRAEARYVMDNCLTPSKSGISVSGRGFCLAKLSTDFIIGPK